MPTPKDSPPPKLPEGARTMPDGSIRLGRVRTRPIVWSVSGNFKDVVFPAKRSERDE